MTRWRMVSITKVMWLGFPSPDMETSQHHLVPLIAVNMINSYHLGKWYHHIQRPQCPTETTSTGTLWLPTRKVGSTTVTRCWESVRPPRDPNVTEIEDEVMGLDPVWMGLDPVWLGRSMKASIVIFRMWLLLDITCLYASLETAKVLVTQDGKMARQTAQIGSDYVLNLKCTWICITHYISLLS